MSKTLIFGGTGSLGRKLIERLLPEQDVAVYSRDEGKHWGVANELTSFREKCLPWKLQFFVGDVRDSHRIIDVTRQYKPDTIIIAAALKQVDTCELSPSEAVLTNLVGTQNIIDAVNARTSTVENVLFVSTDKACAPVNVYGMCKALSERVVTSQARTGLEKVRYLAVRYGNVLESRGSIIPLFKHQGEHGEFLTITDPDMTRYVMTLDDSVDLIRRALRHGVSGETWIPHLPAMRIGDLADIFSKRYDKPIKVIGLRPGEKKHEDLINESESIRTRKVNMPVGFNYIIGPAFNAGGGTKFTYSSSDLVMERDDLEKYLNRLRILDKPLDQFKGATVEEIMTNRKE